MCIRVCTCVCVCVWHVWCGVCVCVHVHVHACLHVMCVWACVCMCVRVEVGGISIYLVNFGVYWLPNIIGRLNRDTEISILFGFTWYELHL